MNIHELYEQAQSIQDWTVRVRRSLHRIPENGFEEYKTQAFIKQTLDNLGIPYSTHRTWVVGDIAGALPGPTVALRADIDALPIQEPEGCPFRSEHDGWMHACGHDMHMTVLLAASRLLFGMKNELCGNVRLLFQPAEETLGGAEPMVAAGVLEGVDAVYGLHVQPYMTVGQIDTRPGCLNGSTDEINITVRGISGHAARPHTGIDAIVCAAQMITALQTVVSRSADPLKPAALSLGTIRGGEARNIMCDVVRIEGTLRTADPALRELLKARIRQVCEGVAAACGAKVDVEIITGYSALMNTPDEAARVLRLGAELLGPENAQLREEPSMGGEDFSYFVEKVPGAFWHLGCSASLPAPSLHSKDLVPDERCLPIGVAMQCALVLDRMGMLE
ncbi:MAG: amidohydrolase [Clostridia bacterium]|nr:amidohydrolase [Clostridia bacterium]